MPISIRAGGVGGLALAVVVWAVPVAGDDGLPPLSKRCAALLVAADQHGMDLGSYCNWNPCRKSCPMTSGRNAR